MHVSAAKPGAANRALTVISSIWNWASSEHDELELPPNPAKGIRRNPEEGHERFLSGDELARLGEVLERAETAGLPYVTSTKRNPAPNMRPSPRTAPGKSTLSQSRRSGCFYSRARGCEKF